MSHNSQKELVFLAELTFLMVVVQQAEERVEAALLAQLAPAPLEEAPEPLEVAPAPLEVARAPPQLPRCCSSEE